MQARSDSSGHISLTSALPRRSNQQRCVKVLFGCNGKLAAKVLCGSSVGHSLPDNRVWRQALFIPLTVIFGSFLCTSYGEVNRSFSVDGNVLYKLFGQTTNEVVFSSTNEFRAEVAGCKWAITSKSIPDNGHAEETMCDGIYTYNTILALSSPGNSASYPSTSGAVKKDVLPFNSGKRMECVWLALASGCYLDTEKPGMFSPAWLDVDHTQPSLRGERFPAQIRRMSGAPQLPMSIDCQNDGFMYDRGGEKKFALRPPFAQGFLCFRYSVQEVTNFDDLELPAHSTFEFFQPRANAKVKTDLRETMRVELRLREVRTLVARTNWRPLLDGNTRIKDFRFVTERANAGMVTYEVSGPSWPVENDPVVIEALRRRAKKSDPGLVVFPRQYIILAMVLVSMASMALIFYRSRQPVH
jgi:hypothetical protein